MKLPFDKSDIHATNLDTENLLRRIATGKAVLFLGSGFTRGATNVVGASLPTAKQLARSLAQMGNFPEDDDLRYVADRLMDVREADEIIAKLVETFTIKEVAPHHATIARTQWIRAYTTNYDITFERAALDAGRIVKQVSIGDSPAENLSKGPVCVHLNGVITNLAADKLNNTFKLSNSSYISPDSFVSSKWLYPFRTDLERSPAIVFIGYSMYDIEVQKILFETPEFVEKTYFVTAPDLSEKDKFTLSKFGQLLEIGVEAFADILDAHLPRFIESAAPIFTTSFSRYVVSEPLAPIRDAEIERFLMYGEAIDSQIDDAVAGVPGAPFLVPRGEIGRAESYAIRGSNVVVLANFGNGKTVARRIICSSMARGGAELYELVDFDGDYIGDLDKLSGSAGTKYLVVDGYTAALALLEHATTMGARNVRFILFARTSDHEGAKRKLKDLDFEYVEISVDRLSADEAEKFVDVVDNVGLWGLSAGASRARKVARVLDDCGAQISLVLLDIFNAPQIKDKISEILAPLMAVATHKDTVFSIALLQYFGLQPTSSLVAFVATNDAIFRSELRSNGGFREIFPIVNGEIHNRSGVFGLAVIRNNFSASYIVSQLLKVVAAVQDSRSQPWQIRTVFRSLMRFSVVERMLPDKNRKDNLVRYYETAKRTQTWLSGEPHYWVQYAMALLTYGEFDRAQSLLDQAYALTVRRDSYHTNNIDTQQARLHFMRALQETEAHKCASLFLEGHKVLSKVPTDMGKLRQIEKYRQMFDQKFAMFSKKDQTTFEHACKALRSELVRARDSGALAVNAESFVQEAIGTVDLILAAVVEGRPTARKH